MKCREYGWISVREPTRMVHSAELGSKRALQAEQEGPMQSTWTVLRFYA